MPEFLELSTGIEQLSMRELSLADARPFWKAINERGAGYPGIRDYADFQMAAEAIDEPDNPAILRMGLHEHEGDTLVGTIEAIPHSSDGTELVAWVRPGYRGKGYASAATKAIVQHLVGTGEVERIYAETDEQDAASQHILARSGFVQTAGHAGKLIFDFAGLLPDEPAARPEVPPIPPRITPVEDAQGFRRPGFTGHEYIRKEEGFGFSALLVNVHGEHPTKRILDGTVRTYFVAHGEGTFMLDGKPQAVKPGDYITIPAGATYSYSGKMQLLETNISPDNSFNDERVSEASNIASEEKPAPAAEKEQLELHVHRDQVTAIKQMADTYHWDMKPAGIPVPEVPAPRPELPTNPDFYRG